MNTPSSRPDGFFRLAGFSVNRPFIRLVAVGVVLLSTALGLNSQTTGPMKGELATPAAAAASPAAPAVSPVPPVAPASGKTLSLYFLNLSFEPLKDPVDAKTGQPHYNDQIPAAIKAYDGRKILIRGYMIPVRMEGSDVREFLIMPNQMSCCYGMPPRFWEFIAARMKTAAAPNLIDQMLTFQGTLHVGDVYENGYWTQLYTMECTAVVE